MNMDDDSRAALMVEELEYWRSVLTGEAKDIYKLREAAEERPYPPRFLEMLPDRPPWWVLDVGSGPVSVLGRDPRAELVQADPLAAEYAAMLEAVGIGPPGRLVAVEGERLVEEFGPESFDLVYSRNALDHTADPLEVLRQMCSVVRRGCWVVAETYINEGAGSGYAGLHRWNFDVKKDGRAILWNRDGSWDVQNEVGHCLDDWTVEKGASLCGRGGASCVIMRGQRP